MCFTLSLAFVARGADIQCVDQATSWCVIVDSTNISDEDNNIAVIGNAGHQENVTHFTWRTTNKVKIIPGIILETFPKIETLDLSIGLESLSQSDFELGGELVTLTLFKNRLRNLPSKVFSKASSLDIIQINANFIDQIEDNAFQGLNKLTTIELLYNSLSTIRRLSFAGANIVNKIDLSNNDIRTIEPGAFDLPNLQWLSLVGNILTTLPTGFINQAPALTTLDLSDNIFSTIPEQLFSNNSVNDLSLDWNPINEIRLVDFNQLPNLQILSLEHIGFIWPTVQNEWSEPSTSAVTELNLAYNDLESADVLKLVSVFKSLEKLNLDGNRIPNINGQSEIYQRFPNLTEITVEDTGLDFNYTRPTSITDN